MLNNKIKPQLIKEFIDNTPVAYIILDETFRIHYINKNFMELRKLDPKTTIGELCYNISNGGVKCSNCTVQKALNTGKRAFSARKDTLQDGSVRYIDDYAIPLSKAKSGEKQFVLEIMVNRTKEMLIKEQRNKDYDEILSILAIMLEAKDAYTANHSKSVRKIALMLAHALNLSDEEIFEIAIAASLHDIGKVNIPNSIINKAGKLNDEEYETIKRHPEESYGMLSGLYSFDDIRNIVWQHHERVDGTGYPFALKGEEISLGARIVAIADTYDAITSTRSYRKALDHKYALEEIKKVAGTQLDAKLVDVFVNMDFNADFDEDFNAKPVKQIARTLNQQTVSSSKEEMEVSDFQNSNFDEDALLKEIFDNTPYGYVLMDKDKKVLFASDNFLKYMGLTEESIIGKICYDAGGVGVEPCKNCAVDRALKSGNVEYMRQEQFTNNGQKIFDLFGIPLKEKDGQAEYIIEVIIDRTGEVQLERSRRHDFTKLVEMLSNVYNQQKDELGEKLLKEKIIPLRKKLNRLLKKQII